METETKKSACRKWQIILGEYVLGTVDERDRARLERHLGRCERCRRELAEMEGMYRLLGDFELAKPEPFFAAKVARAVRSEAEAAAAAPTYEGAFAGLRRWMRRPAVASAVAAASVAAVAAVLYVKVWLPRASQEPVMPAAGEVALKADKLAAASEEKIAAPEERPGTRAGIDVPDDVALSLTEIAATEERVIDELTAAEEERPDVASRRGRAGAGMADEDAPRGYGIAAADEKLFGTLEAKGKEEDAGLAGAPSAARDDAAGTGLRRAEVSMLDRSAVAEPVSPALAGFEETLTASDVEARMDARFEADVERLTRDGTALVDYVTPNGLLMTYFYELPVEEQKTLLSRLRREAEAATAAELLLSH
jgi:anti-sigma factor RsiW